MRNAVRMVLAVAFVGLLANEPALAVDGVVLIDQARAVAGGVTPGDTPGFPVVISQPGSYRLSSNINVPALLTGIEIRVSNVTIDLNGFALTGSPHDIPPFDYGIRYTGPLPARNVTIRNGVIAGFTFPITLGGTYDINTFRFVNGAQATLQDLQMTLGFTGTTSLDLGENSRVMNITARSLSVNVVCPSVVVQSVVRSIDGENPLQCAFANNAKEF